MAGKISLDFNTKKTVWGVLIIEILILALFGNSIIKQLIIYSNSHDVAYRNGALLFLLLFELPIGFVTVLTVKKLLILHTVKSCGVAFTSDHIKPGDSVNFTVGLVTYRNIKIEDITLNIKQINHKEFVQRTYNNNKSEDSVVFNRDWQLAVDLAAERNHAYTFPGTVAIPENAMHSGYLKLKKPAEYYTGTEYLKFRGYPTPTGLTPLPSDKNAPAWILVGESNEWRFKVAVKIKNSPDYAYEEEFRVYPTDKKPENTESDTPARPTDPQGGETQS